MLITMKPTENYLEETTTLEIKNFDKSSEVEKGVDVKS